MEPAVTHASLATHRRTVHRWVHGSILGLAALALLGYVIPSHAVVGQAAHSDYADWGSRPW